MNPLELLQKYYDEYREQEGGDYPPLLIGETGEDGYSPVEFLGFPTHRLSDSQITVILKILIIGARRRREYLNR